MGTAIIGLLGVVIGSFLSMGKDWWFEYRRRCKNIEYLSIHVVCMLDRFVNDCVTVVQDDGLVNGQYDSDGCRSPHASLPKFNPQSIDVEWKSLPASLMYDILSFPNEIEESDAIISSVIEYESNPPDFAEIFDERHYQYSILGLIAAKLALILRKLGKIPEKNIQTGIQLRF
ncbi:MAG TPA: hypothetical protein DDX98_03290 [Bacteroidales bacterium]|jgi:hypothetical protein|nr:hypothetical protein [Bacteroidales bacterium]